jgi:integrase
MLKAAVGEGNQDILRPLLDEYLYLSGYRVNAPEAEMRRLALAYARTAIRMNEKLLSRYEGNDEPTPLVARSLATPMLSEVTAAYLKHFEKRDKAAMLAKVRTAMPLLLDIIGDKPIGSLTQDNLNDFFDGIQTLPPRWKDVCRQQNISARELSKKAVGEMSKGTFDGTYLAVMTPFIRYCKLKWQVRGWPSDLTTEGVEYMGSRRDPENGQRPFKQTELARLFSGAEMAAFARNAAQAHKYWLPTVALFTGARVNELCQLNPQCDIQQDSESTHWYFNITDDSTAHQEVKKSVKTPGSKRKVPIHPKLIELGFLLYVERIKSQGSTLLFPGFPPSVGRASPKAAEWFIDFMRDLGLRDETPKARLVGMHAFRSTLMNRAMILRVVGIETITGHANKVTKLERVIDGQVEGARSDVVVGYQGDFPIDQKMEVLERIHYGSLTFHRPVRV